MKTKFTLTLLVLLELVFVLQSCGDKTQKSNVSTSKITAINTANNNSDDEIDDEYEQEKNTPQESNKNYPKIGNKASDFLPSSGIYEIQYEAKGDLNKDGRDDIVIVLVHKEVKTEERPMLILLQNKDKSYRLDKVSDLIMPVEYNDNDFQMYVSQEISIENGTLKIKLSGAGGPVGNIFSHLKYVGDDLLLTYIETYNAGAGSWLSLYYDLEKGLLTEEITNTMKEDMPSKSKTFKLKKEKHLFESTSPDGVIMEAYDKVDSDW